MLRFSAVVLAALWAGTATSQISCPDGTTLETIDFDTIPNGTALAPGTLLDRQFEDLLEFRIQARKRSSESRTIEDIETNWARVFDSSNPTLGNFDLGTPNKGCPGCNAHTCPGRSAAHKKGYPIAMVTNCEPEGNIVTISDTPEGVDVDKNRFGGYLDFVFKPPMELPHFQLDLLDMQGVSKMELRDVDDTLLQSKRVIGLGDNTKQSVSTHYDIVGKSVKTVRIDMFFSGAVTKFHFCKGEHPSEPIMMEPNITVDSTCPGGKDPVELDFDTLPDGTPLAPATFVQDQWPGVTIIAQRRKNGVLMPTDQNWALIFDSNNPTGNDRDLGSPNKGCPGCTHLTCPGLAHRSGVGFLNAHLTNCVKQNNILIIQENAVTDEPDDNHEGGYVDFVFDKPIQKVLSLEAMTMEDKWNQIKLLDEDGEELHRQFIDGLGANNLQEFVVKFPETPTPIIKTLRLSLDRGGAITRVKYCPVD